MRTTKDFDNAPAAPPSVKSRAKLYIRLVSILLCSIFLTVSVNKLQWLFLQNEMKDGIWLFIKIFITWL